MWPAAEVEETHRSLELRHGVIDSVRPTKAAGYAERVAADKDCRSGETYRTALKL